MISTKSFGFEFYSYLWTAYFTKLAVTQVTGPWGWKAGLINNELHRIGKEAIVSFSWYCPNIFLKELWNLIITVADDLADIRTNDGRNTGPVLYHFIEPFREILRNIHFSFILSSPPTFSKCFPRFSLSNQHLCTLHLPALHACYIPKEFPFLIS